MGVFEFYLYLIFGLLIFGGVFSVIERIISLLKKEKIDFTMDKLNETLKSMFSAPEMFASTPESFEEQICLLMTLKHRNKDIWHELQTFKKQYGVLSTQSLSSKYSFSSKPNISQVLKDFENYL